MVGKPLGHAYEVLDKGKKLTPVPMEESDAVFAFRYEPPAEDNRELVDDNTAQSLGAEQIARLKESGASGRVRPADRIR